MSLRFEIEWHPDEELVEQMAGLLPANPFFTWNYVQSMLQFNDAVVVLAVWDEDRLVVACPAGTQRGFMQYRLEIESVPGFPDNETADTFWTGLVESCRSVSITDLRVCTYASPATPIPNLPGEVSRQKRLEYILDLRHDNPWTKLRKSHKSRVNKGQKSGLKVRRACDEAACRAHVELIAASGRRRTRSGETAVGGTDFDYYMGYLKTGAGELFLAVAPENRPVSSALVLKTEKGAYMHSSGSHPEGMKCGAAHYLKHHISLMLQEEGIEVLNLAGIDRPGGGLDQFKAGFGGEPVQLEEASFYLGSRLKKKVRSALVLLRNNPGQFFRELLPQVEHSVVFVIDPREVTAPEPRPELLLKKLPTEELRRLAEDDDEMGMYARRFVDRPFNDGWAVYCDGRLAHINWLITADHDRTLPIRNVKLRDDEAEITHVITGHEFRGMGIAPYAIRLVIGEAGRQSLKRVYAIVAIDNRASQRVFEKLGFERHGHIFRFVQAYLPGQPYLTWRGHRWGLRNWFKNRGKS